ncbi:MAG: rRNA (cytosine967-C5)-methyltransferase [Solirubrobacteraceae bacterium]|jgi:16S rRNA (cytosine967-C5)-methyltransferase|nr:rRNA (cytosine967-C5)-methyltransferase [Solirubrobacteraceae bacterium]
MKTLGVSPARVVAFAVVRRTFEEGAYADRALHAEAADLDARDRALAMRIAFGTIQRRATLDHVIGVLAERPPGKLDPSVLAALRLGLFQLLFLDGVPAHAAVDESVELAKANGRAAGLVNAVLRRATREAAGLVAALDDETPERAAILHSHPDWLVRMWWDELGAEEARLLLRADNESAEPALRANTLVTTTAALAAKLPVATHPAPGVADGLVAERPFDAHGSALWRDGAFTPQSRASMLVARVVDPQPGERVLDLCAAPGLKTTHLAALMRGEGHLVAIERHEGRAAAMRRTCERMHAANVEVRVGDARRPPVDGEFDRVLVDPPCSGLGTLRSRPDLRWRATEESIEELAGEQAEILATAARHLTPGGVIVYSTCTISRRENEDVIRAFLAGHPQFALEDLIRDGSDFAAWQHPAMPDCLLTLPHRHGTDGFFIARMLRNPTGDAGT